MKPVATLGLASAFAVAALTFAPMPARADVDSPLVKKGLAAYAELDYARAVQLLEAARGESLTREEKVAAYSTLGMAYAALGNTAKAKASFQHLLRVDPSYTIDRAQAPKVRALFEEAKAEVATSGRALAAALPAVTPTLSPATPHEGRPVTLRASWPGGMAKKMTVYFRHEHEPSFSRTTVDAAPDGSFEATVPGLAVVPPVLEYHVVLLDDAGASVAAAGSLGEPLSVAVERAKKPVYARAWFWGVVGGVAAAGAIAAGLAVGLPRSNSAPVTVNAQ